MLHLSFSKICSNDGKDQTVFSLYFSSWFTAVSKNKPSLFWFSELLLDSPSTPVGSDSLILYHVISHRVIILALSHHFRGFPGGSDGKESACKVGDPDLIPELGISPGEGNGNPLQYSCLENSMDRRAWQATVHGVAKSQTLLGDFHFHFITSDSSFVVYPEPFTIYFRCFKTSPHPEYKIWLACVQCPIATDKP